MTQEFLQANLKIVIGREALASGLNGLSWRIVVAGVVIVWYGNFGTVAIVAVAMVIGIAISTLFGPRNAQARGEIRHRQVMQYWQPSPSLPVVLQP